MKQLIELTKELHTSMQLQQQLLQEKFEKSQKDELIHLQNQQTKNTKLFCENALLRTTEGRGSRFFSPEGILNSLSEFK